MRLACTVYAAFSFAKSFLRSSFAPYIDFHPRLARWNVLLSRFADPLPTHERLILFPSVAPLRPFPSTEDAMEGLASQVQVTFRVVRFHPPRMSRESRQPAPILPTPRTSSMNRSGISTQSSTRGITFAN